MQSNHALATDRSIQHTVCMCFNPSCAAKVIWFALCLASLLEPKRVLTCRITTATIESDALYEQQQWLCLQMQCQAPLATVLRWNVGSTLQFCSGLTQATDRLRTCPALYEQQQWLCLQMQGQAPLATVLRWNAGPTLQFCSGLTQATDRLRTCPAPRPRYQLSRYLSAPRQPVFRLNSEHHW